MRAGYSVLVVALFTVVACGGDDGGGGTIDGPRGDGAPIADGPPGGGDGPIADGPPGGGPDAAIGTMCGATSCDLTQECCIETGGGATCVPADTCTSVTLECDGPEDCPEAGEVCCFGAGGGPGDAGSECRPSQQCQTPACHDVSDCDANEMCCDIGPTELKFCAPQCPQ